MKNKKVKSIIIVFISILLTFGCTREVNTEQKAEVQPEKKEEQQAEENIVEETDEVIIEDNNDSERQTAKIYYVDLDTAEIVCDEIERETITPEIIWGEMQSRGVFSDTCAMKECSILQDEKKIDIDVNAEFGNYIRSMGTAGEEEILTCVVNSYLETYNCEQIRITEEGKALDTGHTVLSDYITGR